MLAQVHSCVVTGLDGVIVEVEVDFTQGMPGMTVVGLPDTAVQESRERFKAGSFSGEITSTADIHLVEIKEYCILDEACSTLIKAAMDQLHLSARGYHRVLKLARTIADLAGKEKIETSHLAEALQYRPRLAILE